MEANLTSIRDSLHVPSVKELAEEQRETVPSVYLHPNHEPPLVSSSPSESLLEVPIIDMQLLLSHDSTAEVEKLHGACKSWGFFQLKNHGVSSSLLEKVKSEIKEFFNMPMEEKKKLWKTPEEVEGFGQYFAVSEEQKLDWADVFVITTLPHYMRKPRLFSSLPPSLRESLEEYSIQIKTTAMNLLSIMAKALKMKVEDMKSFEEGCLAMRMNYYPPCPQPEQVIGLTPHSDASGLTLLLQLNETEGLQIKKDGKWIPIKPLSNAFVINIGDILEMMTNGTYPSIEHRATVNSKKERLSIAAFYSPNMEADIGPAPSIVSPEAPAKFKSVAFTEFMKGYLSRKLDGKRNLELYYI